jgi:murein DD-endopeptidase MepM/ murein hydrolase activator NlpD
MTEAIKPPPAVILLGNNSIIFGKAQNAGLPIKNLGHTRDLVAQLQSIMPSANSDAHPSAPLDIDGDPAPFSFADPDNLDFLWPVGTRTISSAWGPRVRTTTVVIKSPNGNRRVRRPYTSDHRGIDLTAPKGHSIFAARDGRGSSIGRNSKLGNYVKIDHGNGVETIYGHNSVNLVATNDIVRRGQIIGRVGSTGRSTGPHLHFEVRINDQPINPAPWLNDTEEISAEILAHNEKFLLNAPRRR